MKNIFFLFFIFSLSASAFLTPTGGGSGGGIQSINGDSTSAQLLSCNSPLSCSTAGGTTTFTSSGGAAAWGSITGTLSSQTDLQSALDLKANLASPTFSGTIGTPLTGSSVVQTTSGGALTTGTVTNAQLAGSIAASKLIGSDITTVGTISSGTWQGTPVSTVYGGTGLATLTANNVLIGNGAGSPTFVAPGSNGNVLTSNGTTWTSAAAGGSGANVALSNLSGVAINTALLPASDNVTNFGSSSFRWHDLNAGNSFTVGNLTYATTISNTLSQVAAVSGNNLTISAGASTSGTGGNLQFRTARGNNAAPINNDGNINFLLGDGSTYMFIDGNQGYLQFPTTTTQRGIHICYNSGCTAAHAGGFEAFDANSMEIYSGGSFHFFTSGAGQWGIDMTTNGSIDVLHVGQGYQVAEGSGGLQGVTTLVGGTKTVTIANVTTSSRCFVTVQALGTVVIPRAVMCAPGAGSIVITSEDATDTSVVAYEIFQPG